MKRHLATAFATVIVAGAGAGVAAHTAVSSATRSGSADAAPVYRKAPTVSCLRQKGIVVAAIKPVDRRLRALRDLAQKTSWQAKKGSRVVGASINRSVDDARFLLDLLRVPNDRYRLDSRGNAVLLYLPAASSLATVVRGCLR